MNTKKAIWTGILLWVLIFFEVSVLMFGLGLEAGFNFYILHYMLLFLLAAVVGLVYFSGRKGNAREGLAVGVTYVIISLILDAVITVPLFVKDYASFFIDPSLWIGALELVVAVFIVGALKK